MTKTLLATLVAVVALFTTQLATAQESHDPAAAEHGKAPGNAGGAGVAEHDESAAKHADASAHDAAGGAHAHGTPNAAAHGATAGGAHGGDHDAGPVVPADRKAVWPGVLLILILTMFALAAVIGPIARMHAPPAEMPVTHSHDEPPGASHHHGSGGTINPEPDHHGHASGHH